MIDRNHALPIKHVLDAKCWFRPDRWIGLGILADQRWRRKFEHSDKWKLCENNPGLRPEKAG